MEGVRSGRRPGQEHSGGAPREHESISSQENRSLGGRGGNWHPYERRTQKATGMGKGSHSKGATTRQSQRPRRSRPNGWGNPDGPPSNCAEEHGPPEEKVRRRSSPTSGRRKDQSEATRARPQDRRDGAHPPPRLHGRRRRPRSPARTPGHGCRQEAPEGAPASPQRLLRSLCGSGRHSPSADARAPLDVLMPGLFNQVGALQVALDELRAPGGAFLPVPAPGPQPEAREPEAGQRAWLSWQRAHTGANLHWALSELDTLLAAQPGLPTQPPCTPRAPQP